MVRVQADFLSDRSLSARYGLSYATLFFVMGVFAPFFPLFLSGQGFDAGAIGFLIAIGGPVRIIAGPLMGWIVDAGMPLRLLGSLALTVAAACLLMMLGVTDLALMAVLIGATAALHAPMGPLVDASLSHRLPHRPALSYARIRLWGSVGFILGNFTGGWTADHLPRSSLAVLMAAGMAVGAAACFLLPRDEKAATAPVQKTAASPRERWGLIAAVIAAAALVQSSHAAVYTISALAWGAQGFSQTATGIFWMLGVITEILLFLRIGNAVSGLTRALLFIALGAVAAAARWAVMATEPGLVLTVLCQTAHGITFGATHLGMIAALAALSPPAWRSRIQGTSAALQALMTSAAIYSSGLLYQNGGSPAAYALMAAMAGSGLVLVTLLYLRERPLSVPVS